MTLEELVLTRSQRTGVPHELDRLSDKDRERFQHLNEKGITPKGRFLSMRNLTTSEKEEVAKFLKWITPLSG